MRRLVLIVLATLLLSNLALLVTDRRVLVHQHRVEPGETYRLEGWGDLGTAQQVQLVCRYWTGRGVVATVLWYSQNNIMGRDQCPLFRSGG